MLLDWVLSSFVDALWRTNQLLQKYNVEEDPTDPASPLLSSSLSLFSRLQLELELDELELDELEGSSLLGWIIETLALIL